MRTLLLLLILSLTAAPDERERLTPNQLAAYLPERVGTFEPVPDSYRAEEHTNFEDSSLVMSAVTLDYKSPLNQARGSGSYDVRIRIVDARDWPALGSDTEVRPLAEGESELWDGRRTTAQQRDGNWFIEIVKEGDFAEVTHQILLPDRFKIELTAKPGPHSELDLEGLGALLRETYETSALSGLGDAPVYAESTQANGPPAWLGGETETTLAALSCDAALPVAEIERICGVSGVRAVDTGMASEGDCNRLYKRGEASSGFIFLLSRYAQAETARRALGVASDTDGDSTPLPELADGGYSFVSSTGEARVAFVARNALIELKASDSALDTDDQKLCLERDQVEEIARSVAERLINP